MLKGVDHLSGYILGEHLSHTFSPQIHSLLADYSYDIKEIAKDSLESFMTSREFDFLNVTIPYKKEVIKYLTSLSEEVKRIGAVNTIKHTKDGNLVGFNTDYYGFAYTLDKSQISVEGAKILVLGSGGASMPVRAVLEDKGAKSIVTISRSGEDNYENITKHFDANVIINTTPVGMYPSNGESLVDLSCFPYCCGVVDIVYNPHKTALMLDAERLGIKCIGGLYMLVAQAKKAAEIFTEQIIDDDIIEKIYNVISFETSNIVLVGMPGCGKSTIGRILAQQTNKNFFDSDDEFTKVFGITPANAIETLGVEKFREMEHKIITELGKNTNCVIATGGGVVTIKENYSPLHQNGTIIYIERDLEALSTSDRPISKSIGLEKLYETRNPLYISFSDFKVTNNKTASDTVKKIIKIIKSETSNEDTCY